MELTATISREPSTIFGTFGRLFMELGPTAFWCHTLELPWKDNRRNVSCIPAGWYKCEQVESPRFKSHLYKLLDVPDRDGILIHAGNVAGDKDFGLATDVEGCILLGLNVGVINRQRAVTASANALALFHSLTQGRKLNLEIRWDHGN